MKKGRNSLHEKQKNSEKKKSKRGVNFEEKKKDQFFSDLSDEEKDQQL